MARRHPVLRALARLAAIAAGLVLAALVLGRWAGGTGPLFSNAVAVVEIRGVIEDATDTLESLERYHRDPKAVAVVLRLDSPGGGVAPSQEIFDAVWRLRGVKPVLASLGNVAASGAYYVAAAADVIVADPGTLTGSIGAIMQFNQVRGLAERLGVSQDVVKSGRYKDLGNPLRPLGEDERAILQGVVDDVLAQFVDAVARGRNLDPAEVRRLADGRVYSGAQAQAVGLVDRLGGLDAAVRLGWERAGQTGDPRVVRTRLGRRPWWLSLLDQAFAPGPRGLGGGLLFLYEGALPR
jgi:protease-4